MGKQQLPQHVYPRSANALRYRRRISGTKEYFTRALVAKQDSPVSEIQREAASLTAAYEAELRFRNARHPDALSDKDLDSAAARFLDRLNVQPGAHSEPQYVLPHPNAKGAEPVYEFAADDAVGFDDFIDDMRQKGRSDDGSDWTPEERKQWALIQRARDALLKPRYRAPRYLSDVLRWYASNRGKGKPSWQTEGRDWERIERRFLGVLSVIGDRLTEDAGTNRAINSGLREYAQREQARGLSGQSVERNMRETIAAFRRVSDVYDLDWNIKTPETNPVPEQQRLVLTPGEMENVLRGCLAESDHVSATILAVIHSMIPSEVAGLEAEDICLDARIPYLRVRGGKTAERRRLVPIAVGLNVLREHISEASAWIKRTSDSAPSATIKKRLKRWTGNTELKLYCLRHTWNDWAATKRIPVAERAYIGGWKSLERDKEFSPRLLEYGLSGLDGDERVRVLHDAQSAVLGRLIDLESKLKGKSRNVVPLRR